MKANYKVGDRVIIAEREYYSDEYKFGFTDDMACYSGYEAIIINVKENNDTNIYAVSDDDAAYSLDIINVGISYDSWSSGMLIPAKPANTTGDCKLNYTTTKEKYKLNFYN